jgi:phage/plasmid-associated DNA primase
MDDTLARIKQLYLDGENDFNAVTIGYPPDKTFELLRLVKATYPVGLPDKFKIYFNSTPDDYARSQLEDFVIDVRHLLKGVEKAGSLHHLYNILGGEFTHDYTDHLISELNGDISTTVINNILLTLKADDPVYNETVLHTLKNRTKISITVLRQMLKTIRTAGEATKKTDWDKVLEGLVHEPYHYLSTGKRLEGYWVKCVDDLDSLYIVTVHHEWMAIVREALRSIDVYGSHDVNEMMQQVAEQKVFTIEEHFKINRDLIHFTNGIYIISRDQFITRHGDTLPPEITDQRTLAPIPHPYHPDTDISDRAYTWDSLLDGWHVQEFQASLHLFFDGDRDVINTWWEWMGYTLTKHIFLKKAAIYHGEPDSGKSTLSQVQQYIFGEQKSSDLSFHELCAQSLGSDSELYDKHLVVEDDLGEEFIKNYERFKKTTGKEYLKFRFMFRDAFTALNIIKFLACANVLPPVKNMGIPFATRWLVFFFKHVFTKDEKDIYWLRRMRHPDVIDYIITKALRHLQVLLKRGYFIGMNPEQVLHWWQLESNIVYKFVHDMCEKVDTIAEADVQADLFRAFKKFADTTNIRSSWVKGQGIFTKQLVNFGHIAVDAGKRERYDEESGQYKMKTVKVYKGIRYDRKKLDALTNPQEEEEGGGGWYTKEDDERHEKLFQEKLLLDTTCNYIMEHITTKPTEPTNPTSLWQEFCKEVENITWKQFDDAIFRLIQDGMVLRRKDMMILENPTM